jgi:hypothetical protein
MRSLQPYRVAEPSFRGAKSLGHLTFAGLLLGLAATACAGPTWGLPDAPGRLVGLRIDVGGAPTPLYPDPRGMSRYYLEAREGAAYDLHLTNRTGERLGVVVSVDGLNVVSGERDFGRGRMYILDPWGSSTIRGWRRSLHDVHRFTFVDEKASYASRSGKANARMGWIEVSVYRERPRPPHCCYEREGRVSPPSARRKDEAAEAAPAPAAPMPPPTMAPPSGAELRDRAPDEAADAGRAGEREEGVASGSLGRRSAPRPDASFPGTGWGQRLVDPVQVVSFEPEPSPAERLTLRYEYAPALRALGIHPWSEVGYDRLRARERGEGGFAQPPLR